MLTRVFLHGALTAVAGAEWTLSVLSPGEALAAIECQRPGLFAHLLAKDKEGVQYRVVCDGLDVASASNTEALTAPIKHFREIHFIPVPAGSSGMGLWEAIAGVVLVAVGVVLMFTPYAAFGPAVIVAGIGLLAAGAVQMFFGPKAPVLASHEAKDKSGSKDDAGSYLFSGPVNVVNQGGPVPLLYGRMIVGSQTISAGIRTASIQLQGEDLTPDERRAELAEALNTGNKVQRDQKDNLARTAEDADE